MYCSPRCSPLSLCLLCTLLLEMKHPQTFLCGLSEWGRSVHMDQTWVNIITAHCSSLEWSGAGPLFFFEYMLVALIPRSIAWTPSSSSSSHLVMRRFGQRESRRWNPYIHVRCAGIHIYEVCLTLTRMSSTAQAAAGVNTHCLHSFTALESSLSSNV